MRTVRFVFLLASILVCAGCASMTAEDVGKGVALGGIGSGSGGLVVVGAVTEIVGGISVEPEPGTPEFEKFKMDAYGRWMPVILNTEFGEQMSIGMTEQQVSEKATGFCKELNVKIAAKQPIMLKRSVLKRLFEEKYLPKEDEVPYLLTTNPYGKNCESHLARVGGVKIKKMIENQPAAAK